MEHFTNALDNPIIFNYNYKYLGSWVESEVVGFISQHFPSSFFPLFSPFFWGGGPLNIRDTL